MKRISIGKCFLLAICVCLAGITCVNAVVVDFKISGKNEIKVGESTQLKSNYHLSNDMINSNERSSEPIDKDVTKESKWSIISNSAAVDDSNNTVDVQDIAKISDDGVITGLKPGIVTVEAEYSGTTETYQVTVKEKDNKNLIIIVCVTCSLIALGTGMFIMYNSRKKRKVGVSNEKDL